MTENPSCPQVEFVNYQWKDNKLYSYTIELSGIKDQCCKNSDNICYTESNEFLKCKVCNRVFNWKRVEHKLSWYEMHKDDLRVAVIFFGTMSVVLSLYGHFVLRWF